MKLDRLSSTRLTRRLASLATALLLLAGAGHVFGYAEDTPTQGSPTQLHSSFHYNLVRTLAAASGFSADYSERIAQVCEAVDVQNFLDVHLGGTDRPEVDQGAQAIGLYYHWPRRGTTGSNGSYTFPGGRDTCSYFLGSDIPEGPNAGICFMTVQNDGEPGPCQVDDEGATVYEVGELEAWAIYGQGLPRFGAPTISFGDDTDPQTPVSGRTIEALGVYLHSLADSYSHEACMQQCAYQGHSANPPNCTAFWWHWTAEYGQGLAGQPNPGVSYTQEAAQAVWQALLVFRQEQGIEGDPLWTNDQVDNFIDQWVTITTGPKRAGAADQAYAQLTGTGP